MMRSKNDSFKSGKRIPVSRRLVSKVRNILKGEM